jgi:large subunit ribosomal protein L6
MSRIGKKVIDIPKDVTVTLNENKIIVKGKHGILERDYSNVLNVEIIGTKYTKQSFSCFGKLI